VSLLLCSLLTAIHCGGELGTEENPLPEDEEDTEENEEDTESEDEGNDPMNVFHDDGEGDVLTETHLRKLHSKLDHDKDGKVAMHEVLKFAHATRKAVAKKEIDSIFDEIESTKDGHLSLEEHLAESAEFHTGMTDEEKELAKKAETAKFRAADMDGDDKLDKDELVHMMHPETHPEVLELHTQEEMRKRDADKDGRLSKKEWEADATPGEHQDPDTHDPSADFHNLDENKDGFISIDELRHWESGKFHLEDAMNKLWDHADKDGDKHLHIDEFAQVADSLEGHDAHPHILDWVFHEDL